MIDRQAFEALVATYEMHGWVLRRVVASKPQSLLTGRDRDIVVTNGVTDAAWFSRPPQPGSIAWEIRYLGASQYALVEHLDENSPDFEDKLRQTEQRLADAVAAKRGA